MNLLNIITSPTSGEMTKPRPISGLKPGRLFQAAKLAIFSGISDTATIIFHYCMEKDQEKDRKPVCQNPLFDTPAFYHTNFNTLSFYLTATLLTVPSWERTTTNVVFFRVVTECLHLLQKRHTIKLIVQ